MQSSLRPLPINQNVFNFMDFPGECVKYIGLACPPIHPMHTIAIDGPTPPPIIGQNFFVSGSLGENWPNNRSVPPLPHSLRSPGCAIEYNSDSKF